MKRLFTIAMLLLSGKCAFAQNLQGGLETWHTYSSGSATNLELPSGWYSADSLVYYYGTLPFGITPQKQVAKSGTAHSGSFSAAITTKNLGILGNITGILTNAKIDIDPSAFGGDPLDAITYTGGTPVSQRIGGISAWVQYTPVGNDTAMMLIQAVKNVSGNPDSVVGEGYAYINQSANWMQVFGNINYVNSTVVPDTIIVAFLSSSSVSAQDGSMLIVDDVNFVSVGINELVQKNTNVIIYPNPAKNILSIEAKEKGTYVWEAYDMQGQKVAQQSFSGKTSVALTNLSNGIYTYSVYDKDGALVQRGKFDVIK